MGFLCHRCGIKMYQGLVVQFSGAISIKFLPRVVFGMNPCKSIVICEEQIPNLPEDSGGLETKRGTSFQRSHLLTSKEKKMYTNGKVVKFVSCVAKNIRPSEWPMAAKS